MSNLVAVKTFFTRFDAEQAKGLLDEFAIPNFIMADDGGGFYPSLTFSTGNVRLMVNARDLIKAKQVLKVLED